MLLDLLDYSVVIATLGGRDSLRRCVAAVIAQSRPPLELVLVVPGGAVADPSFLDAARDVRILDGPRSMTGQRNVGARAARGDVVVFLDDDIILEPDYGAELLAVWERRGLDRIAGVVGICVNDDFFAYGTGNTKRALRALAGLAMIESGGSAQSAPSAE
jgi:glycosyltransferase involved in cell wall biosynthesis